MRVLITSALPYINGIKHLGNLVGSILPSDVFARFNRQIGNEVLFICATDEHGTPAELAALEQNIPVSVYCQKMYDIQADIYHRFNISFDEFGRSSHPDNHEMTKHFCHQLLRNGYIEEQTIKQIYSIDDARFLPDRYVLGTCPHCGYANARGDQCEACTRVLDTTDLVNPRSALSESTNLEIRETRHLFLKQSTLVSEIDKWIDTHTNWPHLVTSIAKKWLKEGVRDRGITRDLSWGIPVDLPGFEGKVFYVWFDAPIAYIATTKTWSDKAPDERDWKSWWWSAEGTSYFQFMAKDNVPFHTISFPATLIGSREPWKMADVIKGFSWLTYYGGKFSTSQKRGIFTDAALEEFPSDYWRYWLMANAPEVDDSTFTFSRFGEQVNKDLNHVLGNFVNRTMRFCTNSFGPVIPAGGTPGDNERELFTELDALIAEYRGHLADVSFRKAMQALRAIWVVGNNYLTVAAPWTTIKSDRDAAECSTRMALNLCRLFALLAWPIIPDAAGKILGAFGPVPAVPPWPSNGAETELGVLAPGQGFEVLPPMFSIIPWERIQELTQKYGGEPEMDEHDAPKAPVRRNK